MPRFLLSSALNHHLWRNAEDGGVRFNKCYDVYARLCLLTLKLKSQLIDGLLWMPLGCCHVHTEHSLQALACTGNKYASLLIHL